MTILSWGTSLAELYSGSVISANVATATTDSARIAPHVSEGVQFPRGSPQLPNLGVEMNLSASVADGWVSWYNNLNGAGTLTDRPTMSIEGDGVELFRIKYLNGVATIQYHNDTIWVNAGASFDVLPDKTFRNDFHFVIHDSVGVLEWYMDGILVGSVAAFDTLRRGETVATKVKFAGASGDSSAHETWLSAAFVSDTDSRLITYTQTAIDGAGAETDFSGLFSDIDEVGADDSDFIQSGVTTEKATYTKGALPTAFDTGFDVVGVGVTVRATKGSASPSNLQLAARENVTNGFSGNKALGVFSPHQHIFIVNPDTSSPWTFTEADDAEVGVQVIT